MPPRCARGTRADVARIAWRSSSSRGVSRVLGENEVGFAQLGKDAQRDVVEVPDRRRTDRERHYRPRRAVRRVPRRRRARRRSGRPTRRAARIDLELLSTGSERLREHGQPRARQELVERGDAEAAADRDPLRAEDVHERPDRNSEVVADLGERRDCGRERGRARLRAGRCTFCATLVGGAAGAVRLDVTATRARALRTERRPRRSPCARARSTRRKRFPVAITPPPTPGPEGQHHEVLHALARPVRETRRTPHSWRRSRTRPAGPGDPPSRRGTKSTSRSGMLTAPSAMPVRWSIRDGIPNPTASTPSRGSDANDVRELVEQRILRIRHRRLLDRLVHPSRPVDRRRRGSSSRRGRRRSRDQPSYPLGNLTRRMAPDEKPYRVYRGGRVKGKVPRAVLGRRAAATRAPTDVPRTGCSAEAAADRRCGRLIGLVALVVLLLVVVWAIAGWFAVLERRLGRERAARPECQGRALRIRAVCWSHTRPPSCCSEPTTTRCGRS